MQTITLPSMSADEYCKDVDTIERCDCCGHHRGGQLVTITTRVGNSYIVCESCARKHFIRAYDGSWHDLRFGYRDDLDERRRTVTDFYDGPTKLYRLGVFIPAHDFSYNHLRFCDDCNSVVHRNDMRLSYIRDDDLHTTDERLLCRECVHDYIANDDYFECASCGELHHIEYLYWSEGENDYICQSCYENNYFTCAHCGEIYDSDDACSDEHSSELYCQHCWDNYVEHYDSDNDEDNEPSDMHHYGYKPDALSFYKTDSDARYLVTHASRGISTGLLYMGVELEYSHDCNSDRYEHSDYIQEHFNDGDDSHFYQKSDSSLHLGIEQVSHPMTLNYWLENMRDVMDTGLDDTAQYIEEGGSDGFHIHISRRGMGLHHRIKFGAFFELCRKHVEIVARRRGSGFAKFIQWDVMQNILTPKELLKSLLVMSCDRYRAVNWRNDKTAEVRVFKTTTDSTEFYAALALVHGAYQFTKRVGWHKMFYAGQCGVLWDWFLDFMAQDKRYLDLFNLLDRLAEQSDSNADYGCIVVSDELDFFFGVHDCERWSTPAAIVINSIERRTREAA